MSKEIKIERKPIPTTGSSGKKKYPFDKMKVGDSIFVEGNINLQGCAAYYSLRHPGVKFMTRTEGSGKRCWRIQ